MEAQLIDEPDLEFGYRGLHPDLRFGIMEHGPSDRGRDRKPSEIKLAVVGTERRAEFVWRQPAMVISRAAILLLIKESVKSMLLLWAGPKDQEHWSYRFVSVHTSQVHRIL